LSAFTNKDGSHKDVGTVTHSTGKSVGKGAAAGLNTRVQDKAAVHRGTVVVPRSAAITKLGVVGAPGNINSRSDKGIAGTTTASHRGPVVRIKVTPHRKVDTASTAQRTILSARRGTGTAVTSLHKEGNTKDKRGAMPNVTGSLGQKPDTVGAVANTIINGSLLSLGFIDAIVKGIDASLAGVIDPPDNGAKSGRFPCKGGCRPATAHNTNR
jgi:hypothetical protein